MTRARRGAVSALAAVAVAGLTLSAVPNGAAVTSDLSTAKAKPSSPLTTSAGARERKGDFDARLGSTKAQLREARTVVSERGTTFDRFTRSLGNQAVINFDPATGTPENLARLDGFLTSRSSASARSVTMGYVRAHLANLGLTAPDLDTLSLRRDYVDVAGIHHLSYTQSINGIPVFGNGLKANVTKSGQLISLQGSPVSGLADLAGTVGKTPAISAESARSAAAHDVGGTVAESKQVGTARHASWKNNDSAQLVYFVTTGGLKLGWSTYVQAEGGEALNYQHVIDADTGAVLYRHDTTNFDRGDAYIYENYPGAKVGGERKLVNLYDAGYIDDVDKHATDYLLFGNYTAAWADLDDDNSPVDADYNFVRREMVAVPGTGNHPSKPQYRLTPFDGVSRLCSAHYVCTWDPEAAGSWRTNKRADVTEAFWHNSKFHDYLKRGPIGFTTKAGNFEASDGDPVWLNALDGADTDAGLPDGNHIDNANMSTPPDGQPPLMQMYLFHAPGTTDSDEPYLPTSSAFDPSVIYHEYTHGLSNRLVVDAAGNSTLNSLQARSMGEAWSDYYAMDYLVHKGFDRDTDASGEVLEGKYLMAAKEPFRTMAIDCPVGARVSNCVTGPHRGGYTYGEIPTVFAGGPEVHASGEVWAQTLWDLRKRLGRTVADMLITRGMELSTADPTFLDMRNAIVQADLAVYDGAHRTGLWKTFAKRGMGWYAGTFDGADAHPMEDFHVPPAADAPTSTISGQVLDADSGAPLANALVTIPGHDSGYTGDYTAVTDASGRYTMANVAAGSYPLVAVFGPGYEVLSQPLDVTAGGTVADFAPRRDWASSAGGGSVTDFNGPDYSPQCGPAGAIDLSQGAGWGSTTGDDASNLTNVMVPKHITVKMASTITLNGLAVNPSNTCGDPGSASTGDYRIETSPDGTTWTTLDEGTFTAADRKLNELTVDSPVPGVQYVKFTMLSPQVPSFATNCPDGPYAGCQFTDMTELEVFGTE
jgi:hypothetical protein